MFRLLNFAVIFSFLLFPNLKAETVNVFMFTEEEFLTLKVKKVIGADSKTKYSLGSNENGNYLRAEAENAASAIGKDIKIRFRPSYFPFTEPSAELDIEWIDKSGNKTWMEVLGCGMVNPKVFKSVGYDSNQFSGLAFGMGIERLAMIKFSITDIRYFYQNDLKFLSQF